MYVPLVGLSIMIAWGAAEIVARWPDMRRWTAGAGIAACLAMASVTWTQTQYWKSTDELFQHAIRMDARNYLAWYYLGRTLMVSSGFASEPISCFQNALAIRPDFAAAHDDLGSVFFTRLGRVTEAVAEYREALRLNPALTSAHVHLATALLRLGEADEARNEYEIILSEDPAYHFGAHLALGLLLANSGDLAEGLVHVQDAVRLEPDDPGAQILLGQMLMNTPGHLSDAISHFGEALRIDPRNAGAHRVRLALRCCAGCLVGARKRSLSWEMAQGIEPDAKVAAQIERLRAGSGNGK